MASSSPARTASLYVVGAAIIHEGRCLVARRSATMASPGLWEFPGGKVEAGETPRDALRREIHEELGIAIEVGELIGVGTATSDGLSIELAVYASAWLSGEIVPDEHDAICWCDAAALHELDWAAADIPVLGRVAARLSGD